jgi:hypothetical protein
MKNLLSLIFLAGLLTSCKGLEDFSKSLELEFSKIGNDKVELCKTALEYDENNEAVQRWFKKAKIDPTKAKNIDRFCEESKGHFESLESLDLSHLTEESLLYGLLMARGLKSLKHVHLAHTDSQETLVDEQLSGLLPWSSFKKMISEELPNLETLNLTGSSLFSEEEIKKMQDRGITIIK